MIVYVSQTDALGDFLNCLPVLSGLNKRFGKYELIIKSRSKRFKGLKELLMYQDLFTSVSFDDEILPYGDIIMMNNWDYREEGNNPDRPTETCRYKNWLDDNYDLDFEVDDDFELKVPNLNLSITDDFYVGDRWSHPMTDTRRSSNVFSYLKTKGFQFLDYDDDLITNAYKIKFSSKPFITNLTGISILSDLLKKETYIIWKPEDFNVEFRNGKDIIWDNGKNINQIFHKHFYLNRNSKLIEENDFRRMI